MFNKVDNQHRPWVRLFLIYGVPALLMQVLLPVYPQWNTVHCSVYADGDFETPAFREEAKPLPQPIQFFLSISMPSAPQAVLPADLAPSRITFSERDAFGGHGIVSRAHSPPLTQTA